MKMSIILLNSKLFCDYLNKSLNTLKYSSNIITNTHVHTCNRVKFYLKKDDIFCDLHEF